MHPQVLLVARAAALLGAGAAVGFAANALRPDRLPLATYDAPLACSGSTAPDPPGETSIAPRAAARMCGRDDVAVLDARSAGRYAEGHVVSALHLPCDAAGNVAQSALARLERARTVIVYGEGEGDAGSVAASLRSRLPRQARVLELAGGFAAWEKESLSCVSGPCDECKEASRP